MKRGVLLLNLGTPDAPDVASVRRYLREFLSDPRVIDLPALVRYILLYVFILPFRPKQSAHAYQSIWTNGGSPLLVHSQNLKKKLQDYLCDDYQVALGMRYGKPDIASALDELSGCDSINIIPLFPQYSSAATGSALAKALEIIAKKQVIPDIHLIRDFYQDDGFIKAQAELIRPLLQTDSHVLLSYHGLPERQLLKAGCERVCQDACPVDLKPNPACYRAQCFASSHALANELSLTPSQYSTAFQSRLGKTPWIKPYTDECLNALYEKGVRHLVVACPSFSADCLETIEEIGMRLKEQWLDYSGTSFSLAPCVNDSDLWVKTLAEWVQSPKPCHQ